MKLPRLKKLFQLRVKVFDNLPELMHIGMTEIEICNIFKKQLIEKGADHTIVYVLCIWTRRL